MYNFRLIVYSTNNNISPQPHPCCAPSAQGPKAGQQMGMPPLMALLPSRTARGLTKMSSSPATLQLVSVAPYRLMLGGMEVTNEEV